MAFKGLSALLGVREAQADPALMQEKFPNTYKGIDYADIASLSPPDAYAKIKQTLGHKLRGVMETDVRGKSAPLAYLDQLTESPIPIFETNQGEGKIWGAYIPKYDKMALQESASMEDKMSTIPHELQHRDDIASGFRPEAAALHDRSILEARAKDPMIREVIKRKIASRNEFTDMPYQGPFSEYIGDIVNRIKYYNTPIPSTDAILADPELQDTLVYAGHHKGYSGDYNNEYVIKKILEEHAKQDKYIKPAWLKQYPQYIKK